MGRPTGGFARDAGREDAGENMVGATQAQESFGRFELVAILCAVAAAGIGVYGTYAGGTPSALGFLLGTAGFVVATRARVVQPGGLRLSMDMEEAAVVASALLLPVPQVWIVAVVGNGIAQLWRHDSVRVACIAWVLPVVGVVPAAAVVGGVAAPDPDPNWIVAALLGTATHAVVSWAAVRLVVSAAHGRPPSTTPVADLLGASIFGLPAGLGGVIIAAAVQVGWWSWFAIGGLALAALAGTRLASNDRLRVEHAMMLMHLRALGDVAEDVPTFLAKSRLAVKDAVDAFATTIETDPAPAAVYSRPIGSELHLSATRVVSAGPLRHVDKRLLDEIAATIGAGVESLQEKVSLARVASSDPLTGLANRRVVDQVAAEKQAGDRWGLVLVDLNNLKAVNDTVGHPAGDAVIIAAATAIQGAIRDVDVAARIGGDEFALIVGDHEAIPGIMKRLATALSRLPAPADLHVGASIGTATAPADGWDLESLMRVADERMYEQKRRVVRPAGYVRPT